MNYLTLEDVIALHDQALQAHGGEPGIHNLGQLEAALAQPHMGFGDFERFSTLVEKAAALGFFLNKNHPFVDGNKRAAHMAMEAFLARNGYEVYADTDEQEELFLRVADGQMSLEQMTEWLDSRVIELSL